MNTTDNIGKSTKKKVLRKNAIAPAVTKQAVHSHQVCAYIAIRGFIGAAGGLAAGD